MLQLITRGPNMIAVHTAQQEKFLKYLQAHFACVPIDYLSMENRLLFSQTIENNHLWQGTNTLYHCRCIRLHQITQHITHRLF